jgi:uncharacterized protein (DUF2141 family)
MANFQSNARGKTASIVGNNEAWFDEAKHLIKLNDGKRKCGEIVKTCHDQPQGFQFTQKTQLNITDTDFDVTNIRKGFMTCHIRALLQIVGLSPVASCTDTDHLAKAFVGYKASVQAIDRLTMYWGTKQLDYNDQYIPEEGFCFASLRSSVNKRS